MQIFSLLAVTDRQIIALLVQPIKADFQLTDTEIGMLQGLAFGMCYGIAGLPIGWAVDRYPRRLILFLGIGFWSLSATLCGLARDFTSLFAGRMAVGVGEASNNPAAVSLISDLFPPHRASVPFGVFSAGFYIGTGLSLAIGGLIIGMFAVDELVHLPVFGNVAPWQAVFIITGLPGLFFAPLAFLICDPRKKTRATASHSKEAPSLLTLQFRARGRVTSHAFAGFAIASMVTVAIGGWTPAFLSRSHGWAPEQIGWPFGMAVCLSGIVGSLGGGWLLDRTSTSGILDAHFVVPGFCTLASLPLLAGAYFMPTPHLALISLALGLTIFSVIAPTSFAIWRRIVPAPLRGRMVALFVLVAGLLGGGVGPVAVGWVTDHVLGDERLLGHSLALVITIAMLSMALIFLSGRGALRSVDDREIDLVNDSLISAR